MPDMTVIAGIQEEVADIYGGIAQIKSSAKEVEANEKNYICKLMLSYYNKGYTSLIAGIGVASTALTAAKKVSSKLKSEISDITGRVQNAFDMDIINMKGLQTEIPKITLSNNSANMPIQTLVKNKIPLDSDYAKNIISGLNQVKTSVIFDLVPSSGELNIETLISSGKLTSAGIDNSISLNYSTYLDKANDKLSDINDKLDSLPNNATDLFGDSLTNSLDDINTTLNDSVFGQLDTLETMFDNAMDIGHVKEICTLLGFIQQYLEDYCTDKEIQEELASKPVSKVIEKVGGTVEEKAVSSDDSSTSTAGNVTTSKYEYKFDFKKAAGVDDSLQAESIDTTTYTMMNIISTVSVGKYGAEGLRNYLSSTNLGKFLPEPYYGYYKDYQSFIQTTSLPEIDRCGYISNKLHLDDEKSRKIFFQGKSYDDAYAVIQSGKTDEAIKKSLLANKYLAEYGMVDIPLTYDDGSLQIPDCKVLLFAPNEDNFTNAVVCSATITKITVDGSDYKCFTLAPMKSSKTGKVPDFFKSYTGVECTFRNLAEENGDYHMYMFR